MKFYKISETMLANLNRIHAHLEAKLQASEQYHHLSMDEVMDTTLELDYLETLQSRITNGAVNGRTIHEMKRLIDSYEKVLDNAVCSVCA